MMMPNCVTPNDFSIGVSLNKYENEYIPVFGINLENFLCLGLSITPTISYF